MQFLLAGIHQCVCAKCGCFLPFSYNCKFRSFLADRVAFLAVNYNTPNIDRFTEHFTDIQQKKIILILSYVANLQTEHKYPIKCIFKEK